MNIAKWLKQFLAVISAGISLERAQWKFIDMAHFVEVAFPVELYLEPTRFTDGKFQPFEYRWLEFVFIPHSFKPKVDVGNEKKQDTVSVLAALEKAGQFPVEFSSEGVTIRGYRV